MSYTKRRVLFIYEQQQSGLQISALQDSIRQEDTEHAHNQKSTPGGLTVPSGDL